MSDACMQWLGCLGAKDPATLQGLGGTYLPGGSCWVDETSAAACEATCTDGLADALAAHPEEPACGGERPVEDWDWPFAEGGWRLTYTDFVENTCDPDADDPDQYFELSVAYLAYPDFTLDLIADQTCAVFRADFVCESVALGGDQVLTLTGTFDSQALGMGTVVVEDSDCVVEVAYMLARTSD